MIYLILFFGLILRLISLNQSLWLDEATSAIAAKMSLTDLFTKFLPGDFHPPLYYLTLKYWTGVFGYSEVALRVPSIIFGIATIYFVYLIGKKVLNSKAGRFSALLLSTSGLAIYYSQEARMYMLATMCVAASVYFFLTKKWIIFGIFLALVGMTDYVSLLVIPVFLIAGWKDIKKVVLSFIPLAALILFWLPVFIKQLTVGLSVAGSPWWNILGMVTLKNIALIPVKFMVGRISFDDKILYGVIVVAVSLLFGCLLYFARKIPRVLWYWLTIPVVLGIILSFKIPALSYFRFLFCLPALYLLIAYGLEKSGKYKKAFLILILGINLLSSGYYLFNYRFQREDWRAAAISTGTDKIVLPGSSQKEALVHYGKEGQITDAQHLTKNDKTIWLSRYVVKIVDPNDTTRLAIERLGYNKASEYNFNGVVFWKYTKK